MSVFVFLFVWYGGRDIFVRNASELMSLGCGLSPEDELDVPDLHLWHLRSPGLCMLSPGGAGVGLDEVNERAPLERISRWSQSHRGGRLEDSPHSLLGGEEIPTQVPAFILVIYNFC